MSTEHLDGIKSAVLVASGGTLASPTGLAELDDAVDNLDIPDEIDQTPLKGRHTRNGNRYTEGAVHLADEVDIDFEIDESSALLGTLRDAYLAGTKLVFLWVPYIPDPTSIAAPTDAAYIKAEYRIFSLAPKHNPGSPNTYTMKLRQKKGYKSVRVYPA